MDFRARFWCYGLCCAGTSAQIGTYRYRRPEDILGRRKAEKIGCTAVVQEGNIRKTMAARGLVNGRDPLRRSGRDLVFRTSPS